MSIALTEEKKSILERFSSKWTTPLFAIASGAYGLFVTGELDKQSKELSNIRTKVETELRQKEFENNLKLTIYKEVKESIAAHSTSQQLATLLVVNEMLKEDSVFRENLKTILLASDSSKSLLTVQRKIDQFSDEQAPVVNTGNTTTTAASAGYKIDVFYLDDVPEAKTRAEKAVTALQKKSSSNVVRLRLLPREINARSGYRIEDNQIRYEQSEKGIANETLKTMKDAGIFSDDEPRLYLTSYSTPGYISVFVKS